MRYAIWTPWGFPRNLYRGSRDGAVSPSFFHPMFFLVLAWLTPVVWWGQVSRIRFVVQIIPGKIPSLRCTINQDPIRIPDSTKIREAENRASQLNNRSMSAMAPPALVLPFTVMSFEGFTSRRSETISIRCSVRVDLDLQF